MAYTSLIILIIKIARLHKKEKNNKKEKRERRREQNNDMYFKFQLCPLFSINPNKFNSVPCFTHPLNKRQNTVD